jgi:hypothetical protein
LGDSGDTIIIPAGATITNNGTATGFGRTGTVNWDTTPKTTTVTAASGIGYFVDTTSGAVTVDLPAGVAGAIVAVSDYANTAATNNITIDPNGTDKINGVNENTKITTNGASATLIYVDSTRGWKDVNDATLDVTGIPPFVAATGGTIVTCGDFKIHTFTGPGTFTVTCAGSPGGSNSVDYLVVAGGGGGGAGRGGGGGAGGFRQNFPSPAIAGLPVSVQGYPITFGAGGAAITAETTGNSGSPSIFSTITSTGGGAGAGSNACGLSGGSGGGAGSANNLSATGGSGNTPPVSPPQGNPGGPAIGGPNPANAGAGGGGASASGVSNSSNNGGAGGAGSANSISGSPVTYAGGGGGSSFPLSGTGGAGGSGGGGAGGGSPRQPGTNGTANTGGGGGGTSSDTAPILSGSGGSGIVVIRYKFQ